MVNNVLALIMTGKILLCCICSSENVKYKTVQGSYLNYMPLDKVNSKFPLKTFNILMKKTSKTALFNYKNMMMCKGT